MMKNLLQLKHWLWYSSVGHRFFGLSSFRGGYGTSFRGCGDGCEGCSILVTMLFSAISSLITVFYLPLNNSHPYYQEITNLLGQGHLLFQINSNKSTGFSNQPCSSLLGCQEHIYFDKIQLLPLIWDFIIEIS